MNKCISFERAKEIMDDNMIGQEDLKSIGKIDFCIPSAIPSIPYTEDEILEKKDEYYLILGVSHFEDGQIISIRNFISIFGKNPEICEPCFYNQDWFDKERFIDEPMTDKWFLIRKEVYEDSRAVSPNDLLRKYIFPSAIDCTYAFFIVWMTRNEVIWKHDFVWCKDVDHNGDRIYVGKYYDIDGINKNGFSIHRHLGLRNCYGCID